MAASSPRNDLVKNYRVHPTQWLISTQVHMALSQQCNRFFHEDDFEYAVLKEGRCPYSRAKEVGDFGTV